MSAKQKTRDELIHEIVMLMKQWASRRAIARSTGISRNTVRRLLAAHEAGRETETIAIEPRPARARRAAKIDRVKPRVDELMKRLPDIAAQRVYEILRDGRIDGGDTGVKKHMRREPPRPKPAPSMTTPDDGVGEMAEIDWSPYEITFTSGKKVVVLAFSYVLVWSKRKQYSLYESIDLFALMNGHERAFTRLEGCARECKYDSQKPVVLRWEGDHPIYNPRFLAFSSQYEFRPLAVQRGHPNDKPRVERSFWEVEQSFLNGREFRDLDDMRNGRWSRRQRRRRSDTPCGCRERRREGEAGTDVTSVVRDHDRRAPEEDGSGHALRDTAGQDLSEGCEPTREIPRRQTQANTQTRESISFSRPLPLVSRPETARRGERRNHPPRPCRGVVRSASRKGRV